MFGFVRLGVKSKLATLFLMFGIVPALVVFVVYSSQEGKIERSLGERLNSVAASLNDVIDRNLFERYGDVQAFGLNVAAWDPANHRKPGSDNMLVGAMNGYMTGYGIYRLMLLIDPKGDVLAVNEVDAKGKPLPTQDLYKRRFADADWFKEAIAGRFLEGTNGFTGTAVGAPRRDPDVSAVYKDDGFVIPFAAQVKNAAGGLVGIWVNFADFGLIEDIVGVFHSDLVKAGMDTAEIALLDKSGTLLVDYDPKGQRTTAYKRNFDVVGRLNLVQAGVVAARDVVSGKSGWGVAIHERKKIEQIAGFAPSGGAYDYPGLKWSALVRVSAGQAFATLNDIHNLMLLAIGVSVGAIVAAGILIGGVAARPLQDMTAAMRRLADNDLAVDIPAVGRRDEIGQMAATVQVFKENAVKVKQLHDEQEALQRRADVEKREAMNKIAADFNARVMGVVESLSESSQQLTASAQTLTATADQASQQTTAVAAASEQATTNVQTVAAAAEELSASIAEISRQVGQSATIANQAVIEAGRTNATVQGLAEAAKRIGEVVKLINDIAGQTNLLALNATIEAARAGDAGKGFAVVASEVKSLANQTAKATDDIAQQIAAIQSATAESVTAIDGIGKTISEIAKITTSIASAVEEQGDATQEIARNVQQAAQGTGEVSANIVGVTEGVALTKTSATEVLGAAGQLSSQSDSLRREVDSFLGNLKSA
jgi:methyl-accepting chemotaxis protein